VTSKPESLPALLKTTAIDYTHMAGLGGLFYPHLLDASNDKLAGLFRPPGSRAILILASERNLQKFSSLCQAQYRKPTGGFFAAFTQSGSTASVSVSMASSCGRYQMTAAMLTNNTSLPISSCTKGTKRSQAHSMIFGVNGNLSNCNHSKTRCDHRRGTWTVQRVNTRFAPAFPGLAIGCRRLGQQPSSIQVLQYSRIKNEGQVKYHCQASDTLEAGLCRERDQAVENFRHASPEGGMT
jgi:hypothetical protein